MIFSNNQNIGSLSKIFEDKAHRSKQSEGVVSYVELLVRSNTVFGNFRLAESVLLAFKILINLLYKLVRIGSVYRASLFNRLSARCRTTKTVRTDLEEELCSSYIVIENIADDGFLSYLHFCLTSLKDIFIHILLYNFYFKKSIDISYIFAIKNIFSLLGKSIQKTKKGLAKCQNLWYNYAEKICLRGHN